MKRRCAWADDDVLMAKYHDDEWGRPERDSRLLWEALMLEGFQAGLSWQTILHKRDNFRRAFVGFDPLRVARFKERDIARLLKDDGIVRSRAKIVATVVGAQIYCDMQDAGDSFADFCWSFTDGKTVTGSAAARTQLSAAISTQLKRRGFKFVGPTIVYAWLQAVGIIDDHQRGCFRYRTARQRR